MLTFARQWAAMMVSGSRLKALASLTTPTLVIHGTADPLIPPGAGRATARAIPGAELLEIQDTYLANEVFFMIKNSSQLNSPIDYSKFINFV